MGGTKLRSLAFGILLGLGSCWNTCQADPSPQVEATSWWPQPDIGPIDSAMIRNGPVTVPEGAVRPGEIAGSMPFAYRRTGVLKKDLTQLALWARGVRAVPAGTPGYYVGTWIFPGFGVPTRDYEIWCFDTGKTGGRAEGLCFILGNQNKTKIGWAIKNNTPFWMNPKIAMNPESNFGTTVPEIDENGVNINSDNKLQYQFIEWTTKGANVQFLVDGLPVCSKVVEYQPDGSVVLGLLGTSYLQLTRDPSDQTAALSKFVEFGAKLNYHLAQYVVVVAVPIGIP